MQLTLARKLGQEAWFADLLFGKMDPHMLARFHRFQAKSMLDLGCGNGKALLCCLYTLGLTHLEGVELASKAEADKAVRKSYKDPRTGQPLGSVEEYWTCIVPNSNDVVTVAKSVSELQQELMISFGSRAERYQPKLPQYDIIVLSHLLHYQTERSAQLILDMVAKCAHSASLIYLSVKDAFENCDIPAPRLLEVCRHFASQHHLVEYKGPFSKEQGQSFIFTNL